MTIDEALRLGEDDFKTAGCDSPRLDALVLMAANIKKDKAFLFSHGEKELSPEEETAYGKIRALRSGGLPLAYIVKNREFYGLPFYVDERVLVPRPETEILVETALEIIRREDRRARIHDLCTGSGCVAIALEHTLSRAGGPPAAISASDISQEALEVFRINCRALLGKPLPHHAADLLSNAPAGLTMITANPPYLSTEEFYAMPVRPEPELALNGGKGGLDTIHRLIEEAADFLLEDGWLVMEASAMQMAAIRSMLNTRCWRDIHIVRDLAGLARVIAARRP